MELYQIISGYEPDTINEIFDKVGLGRYIDNLTMGQASDILGLMGGFISGIAKRPWWAIVPLGVALAPEGVETYYQGISGLEYMAKESIRDLGAVFLATMAGLTARRIVRRRPAYKEKKEDS